MKIPNFSRNHSKDGFLRCQNLGTIHNSKTTILNSDVSIYFLVLGNLKWNFFTMRSWISPKRKSVLGLKRQILAADFPGEKPGPSYGRVLNYWRTSGFYFHIQQFWKRKFLLKNSWAKIFHFDSNCWVVIKCWLNANLIVIIYLHGCNYGGGGKCSDGQIGGLRDEGTAPICAGHWSEAKEEEQTIKNI